MPLDGRGAATRYATSLLLMSFVSVGCQRRVAPLDQARLSGGGVVADLAKGDPEVAIVLAGGWPNCGLV